MGPARYTRVTPGSGCGSPPGKRRDRRRRSPPPPAPRRAPQSAARRGGAGRGRSRSRPEHAQCRAPPVHAGSGGGGRAGPPRGGGDWPAAFPPPTPIGRPPSRGRRPAGRDFRGRCGAGLKAPGSGTGSELSRKVRVGAERGGSAGCGTARGSGAVLRHGEGDYLLRCAGREAQRLRRGAEEGLPKTSAQVPP